MGVFLGVIVLLVSLSFVGLMMWSEWSRQTPVQPLAEAPAARKAAKTAKKAARPAAKKKPTAKKKKK